MSDNQTILRATNLHKSYGSGDAKVNVLRGLDLEVRRGEFLAIMGPSGCGKSTLLHVAGLMTTVDRDEKNSPMGQIEIDGKSVGLSQSDLVAMRRRMIGIVFQRFNLLPVLSAADNVAISLKVRGIAPDRVAIAELLNTLGVCDVAARKPGQMSIGQQQRIAVARAIAHKPAIVLADEPTGNLDSENAAMLLDLFRKMNRQTGQTIVMITHSAEAAAAADRTFRMKDGRIVQ